MSELPGLKGAESDLWYGMMAPAKTDRKVIELLWKESARVLALPGVSGPFEPSGTVLGRQFSRDVFVKLPSGTGYERWGKVVKAAGTKAD